MRRSYRGYDAISSARLTVASRLTLREGMKRGSRLVEAQHYRALCAMPVLPLHRPSLVCLQFSGLCSIPRWCFRRWKPAKSCGKSYGSDARQLDQEITYCAISRGFCRGVGLVVAVESRMIQVAKTPGRY